jgi:phenylpropionate dioxygenase-like ring-hydroxylating dioxygenase large terminal subunit
MMRRHKSHAEYINGPLVTPDAPPGSPAAKQPYIDYGTDRPDPTGLYSAEVARLEWENMWTKVWNLAGLASDIPKVGDYFKYDLGVESFLVVRSAPDRIQAFYNVCHHRGNQIVSEDFGSVSNCFRCAFHGWEYGLDGKLLHIRDEEIFRPEVIADRPSLTEVRCDVWNGIVFICMSDAAPPLLDFLGVIPDHLNAYRLDLYRPLSDIATTWAASWKVSLDAFLEIYHGVDVHPELMAFADPYNTQYDLFPNGISRMMIPRGYVPDVWGDTDAINEGLKNYAMSFGGKLEDFAGVRGGDFKPIFARIKRQWGERNGLKFFDNLSDGQILDNWNYFIFPNVTLNIFSDAVMIQRFRPHPTDPERCVYNAITLSIPVPDPDYRANDLPNFTSSGTNGPKGFTGEERPPRITSDRLEDLGYVLAQDAQLVPRVQKGVKSRAFKGYRMSEQEVRIPHYRAELDRYLRGEKW